MMNLQQFPSLVAFVTTNDEGALQLANYPGDFTNYVGMLYFLQHVALP